MFEKSPTSAQSLEEKVLRGTRRCSRCFSTLPWRSMLIEALQDECSLKDFLTHWLPGRHSHRATEHGGVVMQNKWRKSLVSYCLTSDLFKHPWIAGLQSCDFDDARRWRKFRWRARNRNRLKSVWAIATNVNYAKHLRFFQQDRSSATNFSLPALLPQPCDITLKQPILLLVHFTFFRECVPERSPLWCHRVHW